MMNKLVATTLESKFHVFDLRTRHPTSGYASMTQEVGIQVSQYVFNLALFSF